MNVDNIRRKASEQQISIMALECKAGLGNGIIGKWGKGFCNPMLTSIVAIAKVLNCTVDELLKDE